MAVQNGVKIDGLIDVEDMLGNIAPRMARNINRATIHAVAGEIRDEARENAPRDTGTLRRAIKAIRRKPRDPDRPFSDVRVEHGNSAKNDAWYWHFVEHGTSGGPGRLPTKAQPFIRPAIQTVRGNIRAIYRRKFGQKLEQSLRRKAKRQRR